MSPILTIEDLQGASSSQIQKALKQVTVKDDLFTYLKWLNSPQGALTEGKFRLGHRPRSLGLHPSVIAKEDVCQYRLYLDCTGEIEPSRKFDFENQLIYDQGTLAHSMLQMHFLNMYEGQFQEEVWLKNRRLLLTSHTDGRFRFNGVRFLLEIKTIKEGGNYGFAKVQDRPFKDNLRQLMTYMRLDKCPFGLLLYFCKNNGQLKEHPVVYDEEIWQEIKGRNILPIIEAVEANKPPPPKVGWHCKRCDYFHGCKYGKEQGRNARFARRSNGRGAVLPRSGRFCAQ